MRFFTSFWILILILFSTHVGWGQTVSVGDELYSETFGTFGSSSTTFTASNMSTYTKIGSVTYVPSDVSSLSFSGSNAMYTTSSGSNVTDGHVWLNKSTTGYIEISNIPIYNASKVDILFNKGGSSGITVSVSGVSKTLNSPATGVQIAATDFSVTGSTMTLRFTRPDNTTNIRIDNFVVKVTEITSTSPLITLPTTSLSSFNYCFGSGPSAQQNFTISGSNLTDNITVTPPTNYEISTTSGSGFTSSAITLTHSSGTVASTTIYTRLKAGLAAGNYNGETISITSTDATSKSVTLNGSVTAPSTPTVSISASTNSICPGTNVTFTATPSNLGGGTASYQWKKNGSDVGTGTTYATTSLANDDVITCVMTVAGGCVSPNTASSNGITMIVNTANTVTFNKNATSATGTMANQTACQATNLTNNAYTNAGYIFAGWNTQPDGSGTSYANGDSYDFSVNTTLYAQWVEGSIVCYDFGVASASDGFGSSVAVDPYISFQSYKNSGTTNPALHAGGLRLYQNAIKGGGIVFSAADPAIITDVEIVLQNHSDGGGPANYTINGIAGGSFASGLSILNINGVSADSVGLYNTGSNSSNRTYIQSFCVTYILPPPIVLCDHTVTSISPASAPVGTIIRINGTGFTTSTTVTVDDISAVTTFINSTTLEVIIPVGATSGTIKVTENGCSVENNSFQVDLLDGTCNSSSGNYEILIWKGGVEDFDANYHLVLSGTIPDNTAWVIGCGSGTSSGTGNVSTNKIPFGFNSDERIVLYKNGVALDRFGTTGTSNWMTEGKTYRRASTITGPTSSYIASQWSNVNYTTSNLGTHTFTNSTLSDLVISEVADPSSGNNHYIEIYNKTGSEINFGASTIILPSITSQPVSVSGCSAVFSVEAESVSGNPLTYQWYYLDESDWTWKPVSSSDPSGLVITGYNTNTLSITNSNSTESRYQFYCKITESTCSIFSNTVQFNPRGERYYKSTQSGNWTTVSTWLMAPAVSGPWSAACTYPTATNSDYISIENGHTVTLDIDLDADQIIVQSTGTLVLNEKLTVPNGNASTEDLLVEGTLIDNGNTTNGIAFVNGGTWLLGTQGTIIKTWSSGVLPYKENYQGGISTIPATAHWYYRYVGNDLVVTTTVGMYYPNLYFESSAGFHAWDAATEVLSGSTATAVVKGNLSIGATNTGTVEVFNNNTFASPILVHGNVYVGAGSALRNTSQGGGIGTGFEIKGETIEIEGNYVMESGTIGKTILSGAALQNIVSLTGNGQFLNAHVELNNTNDARLNGIDMDISSTLTFTDGVIHTILAQADKVNITNSATTAIVNAQATSAQNRYVNGKLQWTLANGGTYTFPVGSTKGTYGAQGFTFTVDNGAGDVLAYLETNISAPIKDYAYCDLEEHTGVGIVNAGDGNPGYDGILDQIEFNIHSPLQWNITNPSGGSITQYDIVVLATGLQDINPVVTANNIPVRYLMRNGQPGNPTVPTTSTPDFAALGFDMCPNQYTLENMTGFSFFTLDGATQEGTVSPIEVISFTGEAVNNNAAVLNWITATELNNDYFTLYYSADGVQFDELVRVSGAGTSNQTNYYTHRHTLLNRGVHYYKLYSTDYDGTNYYRGIVAVEIEGTQVYFNPVTATIELLHKDDVKLYTTDGKLIAEGTNVNSIPVHHKGVFLLHFLRSGKTERLVIY